MKKRHRRYYSTSQRILASSTKPKFIPVNNENSRSTEFTKGVDRSGKGFEVNGKNRSQGFSTLPNPENERLRGYQNSLREIKQINTDDTLINNTKTPEFNPYDAIKNRDINQKQLPRCSPKPSNSGQNSGSRGGGRINAPRGSYNIDRSPARNIDGSDNDPFTNDSSTMVA